MQGTKTKFYGKLHLSGELRKAHFPAERTWCNALDFHYLEYQ